MQNDILIYEDGKVCISQDALEIPEVKAFYDSDKKTGKPKFNAYMRALYYLYSKVSPYANMDFVERVHRVEERHVGVRKWSTMITDPLFKNVVELYQDIIMTKEERQYSVQYDRILSDIDRTIEVLQTVPIKKKAKVQADYKDPGTGDMVKQFVEVEILNMTERLEAQNSLKKMFEFQDYIKERMKRKDIIVQKKKYIPLFDNPKI